MECNLALYGFGVLFTRLISRDRMPSLPENLDAICSPTRYEEMDRFLQERDPSTSFGDGSHEAQRRKARVKAFRGYVRQLSEDFHQVSKAVKLMMLESSVDRPDMARILMKQRLVFAYAMVSMEFKLIMYEAGVSGIEEQLLTGSLRALQVHLQSLTALVQPSGA
jgi:hypothetical protein